MLSQRRHAPTRRALQVCGDRRFVIAARSTPDGMGDVPPSVINTASALPIPQLAALRVALFSPFLVYISPYSKNRLTFFLVFAVSLAGLLCDRHFRVAQDDLARARHGAGLAPIQIPGDLSAD